MFRPAHSSLYLLCSQKRERDKLIPLFSFHCNMTTVFQDCHFTVEGLSFLFILPERVLT